jgi:hypothetical protein
MQVVQVVMLVTPAALAVNQVAFMLTLRKWWHNKHRLVIAETDSLHCTVETQPTVPTICEIWYIVIFISAPIWIPVQFHMHNALFSALQC